MSWRQRAGESLTRSPTDKNCPTWSLEGPEKGDGKDKPKQPYNEALEIGVTGTAAEAINPLGTTAKGAKKGVAISCGRSDQQG